MTQARHDLELDPPPEILLQQFEYALRIPLFHLAKQFLEPGYPDDKASLDAKVQPIDSDTLPLFLAKKHLIGFGQD